MTGPTGTAASRHEAITRWLSAEGRLDVVDVATRLGVAAETVRRDLRTLETAGKLQRVHGGAVALDAQPLATLNAHLTSTPDALATMDAADLALAAGVWRDLPRTGTILLGAGRLTAALAHAVMLAPPEEAGLTVVTTSLDAAIVLSRLAEIAVYNIGGTVSATTRAQEGDWALEELRRLHVAVGVVAPAGISAAGGLTQTTHAAAAVAQAEVGCADHVIALADVGSLGRTALVRFAGPEQVDEVRVAGRPDAAAVTALREAGVPVRLADPDSVVDVRVRLEAARWADGAQDRTGAQD